MTSQQIRCFLYVASCKNFSAAAEQLYLSQSAVSYHVRSLEKELGFPLFERNTHGVTLTPAGDSFYKSMAAIVEQYNDAVDTARQIASGDQNKLKICFANPTSPTMMGQIVNRLYNIFTIEEIRLIKRSYDDVLNPLLLGTADILFTYPHFFRENLGLRRKDFCKVWTSCMVSGSHLLASRKTLTLADLKGQHLLFPDCRNIQIEFGQIFDYIKEAHDAVPFMDQTPQTFEQVQGLAMAGRGVMLVRTMDCEYHENIDGLVSIPLMDVKQEKLIVVWHEDKLCPLGKKLIRSIPKID